MAVKPAMPVDGVHESAQRAPQVGLSTLRGVRAKEETKRRQRLVLGGGQDLPVDGQVGEGRLDVTDAHLLRMAHPVMDDEAPDPAYAGLLRPWAVLPPRDSVSNLVEEPWRAMRHGLTATSGVICI